MKLPNDPECVALVKALRPFLSDRGQVAVDDLLGSVNLMNIYESIGDVVKRRRGSGNERPLAFLSSLAYMDIDPKMIAKAVDSMIDMPGRPQGPDPKDQISPQPQNAGPRPEDVTAMLQGVMARAARDPHFAALLGSIAEEGMRGNMLPKLMEVLGPELMGGGNRDGNA